MRLTRAGTVLLCLIVFLAAPIATAAAEIELDGTYRPTPVGTKAAYNYGESYVVTAIDGDKTYYEGDRSSQAQNTTWYKYKAWYYSLGDDGSPVTFDEEAIDSLFPLKVGNEATIKGVQGTWKWKTKYKVMNAKEVDTLIGKRAVFVVGFWVSGEGNFTSKGWGYFDPAISIWHRGTIKFGNGDKYDWKSLVLELPE